MRWMILLSFCSFVMIFTSYSMLSMEGNQELLNEAKNSWNEEEMVEVPQNQEEVNEKPQLEDTQLEEKQKEVNKKYKLNQRNFLIQPLEEGVPEKVVLLTIDDAPDQYALEMAKILHELEVNAIFFVNGIFIKKGSGIEHLKKIHELGFEIGNHTMTHPNLKELSPEEQRKEIVELNDLIEEIIGERPRFFRAPFGANTDISKQVVEEEGMQWMNWTYGYDYFPEYMEAEILAEKMVESELLIKGANLLMHDRKWTKEALKDIVAGLREKGYEFVDPKQIK